MANAQTNDAVTGMNAGAAPSAGRFRVVPQDPVRAAALQRSALGAGAAAVMAMVIALAAVLDLLEPEVAVEGCALLGVLILIFYALMRSGFSQRFADASLGAWQVGCAFLLLAYLTYRAEDTPAALALLYPVAMLYGVMRLEMVPLALLAATGIVSYAVAVSILIHRGHLPDPAAPWTQFGALTFALFWFAAVGRSVSGLRARLAEAQRKLYELAEAARDSASRDALTGAYHRGHLLEVLERELARAARVGKPMSLARVDIDRFRRVNERYGYSVGDAVLKRFTEVAQRAIRDVDVFGRHGGKEFLLIMPDTDLAGAVIAGERLRVGVAQEVFPQIAPDAPLTCSCGVSAYAKGENLGLFLGRAEAGLNYAKAAGRNRVIALGADGKPTAVENPAVPE